jgi:hypothetical protein
MYDLVWVNNLTDWSLQEESWKPASRTTEADATGDVR